MNSEPGYSDTPLNEKGEVLKVNLLTEGVRFHVKRPATHVVVVTGGAKCAHGADGPSYTTLGNGIAQKLFWYSKGPSTMCYGETLRAHYKISVWGTH